MQQRMILFMVCSILLGGCNSDKREIRKLLKNIMNRQITFDWPKEYIYHDRVIAGEDHIIDTPLKIVIYKDSTSCATCMNTYLLMGSEFMEYANNDQVFNIDSVSFIVIMSRSRSNIQECFQGKDIPNVVLINDLKNEFKKSNGIKNYKDSFTAFLLDKNNRVAAVGDLMTNIRVRELYIKRINELLAK